MKRILRSIPTLPLALVALFLLLAPFRPEPHVMEKFRLLSAGELQRPLDIFDLIFHLSPTGLLLAKLITKRTGNDAR